MGTSTKQRTRLAVENLEVRENPAVTANIVNGVLEVRGDGWQNHIELTDDATKIYVYAESAPASNPNQTPAVVSKSFDLAAVKEIKVWGSGANDFIDNYVDVRTLTAWGGAGNDTLDGSDGTDNLYGGDGNDTIRGFGGNDGLYGGYGTDKLYGGNGKDRLLQAKGQTEIKDAAAEDAVITFATGAKAWTPAEIEKIDAGLKVLHLRTGNDNLLERASGAGVSFVRGSTDGNTLGWNQENGKITIYNGALVDTPTAAQVAIHEMGHNWDYDDEMSAAQWQQWLNLSGWSTTNGPGKVVSGDGNWFHNATAPFARDYGKRAPWEDLCTCWERYFALEYNLYDAFETEPMGQAKYDFLDTFFNGLM